MVAVDASLVEQVATERISGSVPAEHRLVPGSVKVSADQGQADGDLVDFRVTASAAAIPLLDAGGPARCHPGQAGGGG